ncbi:MAG: class I SAM-dependent methyltransferase [Lachnospiraceae bacterium]|nr:class I SAM-dependent methyltransferase [Lachnospiraceae bacterium]
MQEIIIFGRGKYFSAKAEEIQKQYKIVAFLDNAVKEEAFDSNYHCPIYNPKRLEAVSQYDILIVSSYFIDMWKQLKELCVQDDRIIFGNMIEPLWLGLETFAFSNGEKLSSAGSSLMYQNGSETYYFKSEQEFQNILRTVGKYRYPAISSVSSLPVMPVSRVFGSERGKAVDRYYIEKFLEDNQADIQGCCVEVGADVYTKRYGGNKVIESCVTHVEGYGNARKVNFETGEGCHESMADCLICTQTLQYIYDVRTAMKNIYMILKPKGVALITVPGIKSLCLFDEDSWGENWSFTEKSMESLCRELGDKAAFFVRSYGNAKIATAYLYGICCEELCESDFAYQDRQYPFLITARIQKLQN